VEPTASAVLICTDPLARHHLPDLSRPASDVCDSGHMILHRWVVAELAAKRHQPQEIVLNRHSIRQTA
jgi:hypothetical protein